MIPQELGSLIAVTDLGLYCPAGGFYIDPWRPVPHALITHAHADHASPGSDSYLAAPTCAPLLHLRLGAAANVEEAPWRQLRRINDVEVSFHPAGHILGSSQIRLRHQRGGPTLVITGDFKTEPDPTCEPYEQLDADVLITETTFGLPIYRWPPAQQVFAEINRWRADNAAAGATSILITYALGKAQRVLSGLDPSVGPIGLHGAVHNCTEVYRRAGIDLPATVHADARAAPALRGAGTVIAPPSALGSPWIDRFAGPGGVRTAMVSGWMAVRGRRRWRSVDRGFILSDHVDWPALLRAVDASGARCVGTTHGYAEPVARWVAQSRGLETFTIPTRFTGEAPPTGAADPEDASPPESSPPDAGDTG